ncbi:particle associated protein [Yersinia phage fHe-Yen8-01]|nr:particle associated protein [Yersinia phage fHe-Yen8-01]
MELNHHTDPAGLNRSVNEADGSAYLGSIDVVRQLLMGFASDCVSRIAKVQSNQMTEKEGMEADRAQALNTANIFAGQTPGFQPLPGWNGFGLANYLKTRYGLGTDETQDNMVIAHAMARLIHGVYGAFEQGGSDEQIGTRIRSSVESLTLMLMGVESCD